MLRGSRSSLKNRVLGWDCSGGKKQTVKYIKKTKEEKVKNLNQRQSGLLLPTLAPWFSQLFSPPPAQETRESKEKEAPFPSLTQLTK